MNRSPKRNTFQKERYLQRCAENDQSVNEDYLKMFDDIINQEQSKFVDPESRVDNMEYDLLTTKWICDKAKVSEVYAQNLYAAICNNNFIHNLVWPILSGKSWGCSWRYAGGIIADMREEGDYIDWYCSGIKGKPSINEEGKENNDGINGYVGEGVVTDEIRDDLLKLGWLVVNDDHDV